MTNKSILGARQTSCTEHIYSECLCTDIWVIAKHGQLCWHDTLLHAHVKLATMCVCRSRQSSSQT